MTEVVSASRPPAVRWVEYALLALILSVALIARLHEIGGASFWGDEFLSAEVSDGHGYSHLDLPTDRVLPPQPDAFEISSAGPWSATWDALQRSTHPPLYFLLLRAWRTLGGFDDDASLRMLSTLFSVAMLTFAFDAVRVQQRSNSAGLWAAAVLALANVQVQFAQEARSYSLLCLTMLAACAALVRIEHMGRNRRRVISLFLATLAMLLTHYLGVIICGLLAVYASIELPRRSRNAVLRSIGASAAAALLIWGPALLVQLQIVHERLHWLVQQPDNHVLTTLGRLLRWPIGTLVNLGWRPGASSYAAALLLGLLPLLARKHRALRLWTLLALGELLLVALSDLCAGTVALNFPRYTLPAATAAAILVPLIMLQLPGALLRQAAPAAIVLACAAALPLSYHRDKPDYRQLATYFDRHCPGDSAIVFTAILPTDDPSLLALALSRYMIDSRRQIVVLPPLQPVSALANLRESAVVDVVSDAFSAERLLKGGTVIDAGFFPGIGSCTRVMLGTAASEPHANGLKIADASHARF